MCVRKLGFPWQALPATYWEKRACPRSLGIPIPCTGAKQNSRMDATLVYDLEFKLLAVTAASLQTPGASKAGKAYTSHG
eukprot:1150287-Pelagomonas_calceolata.AAC.9